MFMLNLMLTVIGIIFFVFGFLITFKHKYNLVSFFAPTKADNSYAEQIGLILLMSGMLYLLTSIMALVFASVLFSILMIAVCLAITSSMFVVSTVRASRA